MNSYLIKIGVLVLASLAVVACGGGGGGGGGGTNNSVSSVSSSSSSVAVAKLDQQPLVFSEATFDLFIDHGLLINTLTGGSGEGAVSFGSSNTDVATVDQASGEVSVVGAGSTTISATKSADNIYNATTATYSLTVSKYDQDPLVFEQANIQAFINAPILGNPVSGGSGTGAISYEIGDPNIASIDTTSGTVSLLRPGVTSVTATKAGDGMYNSTTTSYALSAVEVLSGLEILVRQNETLIEWGGQSGVINLGRTTNANCDIDNILLCANRRLTTITNPAQTPLVDSYIKTTRSAYLTFQNETYRSNPINVRVPLAPFPKRRGGQMVGFQGKLWMIGGMDNPDGSNVEGTTWYNDIWSSEDGISWTLETSNAAFEARTEHQMIVYQDELYLIGGKIPTGTGSYLLKFDVWKSSDGMLWQEISSGAPFLGATSAELIVFNDKIWAIGGGLWTNNIEIWSTTDGINWTLENATAPFGPRQDHALYIANNLLMLLGGTGSGYTKLNDVWSSVDGVSWKEEAQSTSFAPRAEMQVQNLNGTLWLTGGYSSGSDDGTNLYSSADGVSWTLAATHIPKVIQYDALALHNNALWIYGGFENGLIWKTNNGTDWGVPVDASTTWKLRP